MTQWQGSAWRCTHCDINWPFMDQYRVCPFCRHQTWEAEKTMALTSPQAEQEIRMRRLSEKKHADFERYYEERAIKELHEELDSLLC